ncbi:hypothetical protein ACN38_g7060 [Penicillium nordicum]|uniref:Uncharacterized protein n=1 Tax=Penicillium nordicum TaxID=229535 RepID=A0A0M8P7K9_9EURO|nr:hypothetical protein ACN38_g7060 [Penicillium nordicum]
MTKAGSGATDQPQTNRIRWNSQFPGFLSQFQVLRHPTAPLEAGLTLNNCRSTDKTEIYSSTKKKKKKKKPIQKKKKKKKTNSKQKKCRALNNCQSGLYSNRGPLILLSSKTSPLEQCHLWLSFIHHDLGFDSATSPNRGSHPPEQATLLPVQDPQLSHSATKLHKYG